MRIIALAILTTGVLALCGCHCRVNLKEGHTNPNQPQSVIENQNGVDTQLNTTGDEYGRPKNRKERNRLFHFRLFSR